MAKISPTGVGRKFIYILLGFLLIAGIAGVFFGRADAPRPPRITNIFCHNSPQALGTPAVAGSFAACPGRPANASGYEYISVRATYSVNISQIDPGSPGAEEATDANAWYSVLRVKKSNVASTSDDPKLDTSYKIISTDQGLSASCLNTAQCIAEFNNVSTLAIGAALGALPNETLMATLQVLFIARHPATEEEIYVASSGPVNVVINPSCRVNNAQTPFCPTPVKKTI